MTDRLGDHFTVDEFTLSQTAERLGIPVEMPPGSPQRRAAEALVSHILDPLRREIVAPVIITSGYRPPRLNAAIGGSSTSQHMAGEAADIVAVGYSASALASVIETGGYPYDQLILEYGRWVHVSYRADSPRGSTLTAVRGRDGRVQYLAGLHPEAFVTGGSRDHGMG